MKEQDLKHLAMITLANLPRGSIKLTEDEIIAAMKAAVAKEKAIGQQLLAKDRRLDEFQSVVAPMVWDAAHGIV